MRKDSKLKGFEKVCVQSITVDTKGALLAAFECAICTESYDTFYTNIELVRKTGSTFYKLIHEPSINDKSGRAIRGVKARLRKIKAKELLA